MEALTLLEAKISALVELAKKLKAENGKLQMENNGLALKLEALENSLLKESQNSENLNQEKLITKMVVDDIIKNIDLLVEQSQ